MYVRVYRKSLKSLLKYAVERLDINNHF